MNPTHPLPERENIFTEVEYFCPFLHAFPRRKPLTFIFIVPVSQRQTLLPFLLLLRHAFSATHPPTMCLTSTPCLLPSTLIFQLTITDPLADQPPHSSDNASIPHPRTDPAPHMATSSISSILMPDSSENCSQTPLIHH